MNYRDTYIDNLILNVRYLTDKLDNACNYLECDRATPIYQADIIRAHLQMDSDKHVLNLYLKELNFTGRRYFTRLECNAARNYYWRTSDDQLIDEFERVNDPVFTNFYDWLCNEMRESEAARAGDY